MSPGRGEAGVGGGIALVATTILLCAAAPVLAREPCLPAELPGVPAVSLNRIEDELRCRVTAIVAGFTTSGTVGPVQAPVSRELYEFLLDHPWIIASLARQLDLGAYQAVAKGSGQFWAEDDDGTEGLIRLLYQDQAVRLYYIDGSHHGHIFPLVRAKAVVVMKLGQARRGPAPVTVETTLQAFTRLDDPLLDGLVRVLRPLVAGAVTRKLTQAFEVLNEVCARMAQDPDRILTQADRTTFADPGEGESLKSLLRKLPRRAAHIPSSAVTP
ncbi:hypothetical protein [Nitrospira sp. Kam-Ns4a]